MPGPETLLRLGRWESPDRTWSPDSISMGRNRTGAFSSQSGGRAFPWRDRALPSGVGARSPFSDALEVWKPEPNERRGAQPKLSDLANDTARTLRLVFHFPLLHAEGFLGSLFKLMGVALEAPDHTTFFRRSAELKISPCATRS